MRLLAAMAVIAMLLTGCSAGSEPPKKAKSLNVWVFSQEYAQTMETTFLMYNPGIDWELDVRVVEPSQLASTLETAQRTGVDLPDVFMLSPELLPEFTESDNTAVLSSLGLEFDSSRYYEYAFSMGKASSGEVKAICWQADPAMFFYRRSMARVYLGSDDPEFIAPMLENWDSFLAAARQISEASQGNTRMTAGLQDVLTAYASTLTGGWIGGDGELKLPDGAESMFDFAIDYTSEKLCYDAEQWSEAWTAGISDPAAVFGYFSSPTGMEYVLKKACGGVVTEEGSFGDWAVVSGPASFNQGGVWLAAYSGSEMKEEAGIFISYFASEQTAMRRFFLQSGLLPADMAVAEQIKFDPQFIEPFLGGQNCFAAAGDAAGQIRAKTVTQFDKRLNSALCDAAGAFAASQKTREQAMEDFYTTAASILGQ